MALFYSLSAIFTLALQLSLVRSRPAQPAASNRSVSLRLPNLNITRTSFQASQYANAVVSNDHVISSYVIPNTAITLMIFSDSDIPMPPLGITFCLEEVIAYAHTQLPDIPLYESYRYHHNSEVEFEISPTSYVYDLIWSDVAIVAGGLLDYFHFSGLWEESVMYIEDAERGPVGSCSIRSLRTGRSPSPHGNGSATASLFKE